ncbi:WD40-repeat-containing domain protein [Lophiotrema nucula]|uniref:WD40-repeat-containing domain protein n=1 Tax=Lophiotrema nucula TaxID=690887 RepID=A0A6A5ZKK5_9PLEO|nr:WD40-repeat-containing domain protein [Lophiotrema nucula]
MDGREIPGYYFDREKGKYFIILKNSPESQYDADNIKKRQREERRRTTEADLHRRRQQRLAKPTFSLARASVQRELTGDRQAALSAWPHMSTAGYETLNVYYSPTTRFFDLDPNNQDLFVAETSSVVQIPQPCKYTQHDFEYPPEYSSHHAALLIHLTSEISSMHYMSASGAMVTTTFGSDRPPVIYLSDPARDGPCIGEQITPSSATTIWTSAPLPSFSTSTHSVPAADTEHIAVGASRDLVMLSRSQQTSLWDSKMAKKFASDVLALDWLDHKTVAVGLRDGNVHIYDTRSGGSSQVISHPTPVTHLKRADDFTRIVCKGLQNTLMLYDMRYAKPIETLNQHSRSKKRKHNRNSQQSSTGTHSRPLLQFPYFNEDTTDLGLAVHSRLGLVAAADEDARVVLWSLKNGDVVRQFETPKPLAPRKSIYTPDEMRIRCMRFVEDDGGSGVSLWSVWQQGIARFGW